MAAPIRPEFFEVTAQVIPLVLLAVLVDHPGTSGDDDPDAPRHRLGGPQRRLALARLATLVALVWAELAALVAVAGRPTRFEFAVVFFGLGVGGLALIDRVVTAEIDRLIPTMRQRGRVATMLVFSLAVLVPLCVAAVVVGF